MGGFGSSPTKAEVKSFFIGHKGETMEIGKVKFAKVYAKTNGRCAYCGDVFDENNYSIDHLLPKSKGGSDCEENLFLSCKSCNSRKKNRTLKEFRFYASLYAYEMPHFKYEQFLYLKNNITDFEKQFFRKGQVKFYYETLNEKEIMK